MPPGTETVLLDGHSLTLDLLDAAARRRAPVALAPAAAEAIARSAAQVRDLAGGDRPVYGVNTGYGVFAGTRVSPPDLPALSRNLILSHAVGVGEPFPPATTRAAIVIRANTLAKGFSGVSKDVVESLLRLLEADLIPAIPSQGSLGASGDLAPLAHLGLALIAPDLVPDEPPAWLAGDRVPFRSAADRIGYRAISLGPKDGLALTNGATFSAALLGLACVDFRRLLLAAEAAAAMSFEALRGSSAALDPRLHAARSHPGQQRVARRLVDLLAGSTLVDSGDQVQDAYSLRCTPQILGPAWEILAFSEGVAARELNAATDNPLLFDGQAVSGGNFHGEPIGLVCDFLKIAAAEVGAVSERRTFRLLSPHTSRGLPPMLVSRPQKAGLESGLMMLQYTAASLVLENQGLATPASVRSLPTSADQEDHNPNAAAAARDLARSLQNLERVVAIELLAAAAAIDHRLQRDPAARPGEGVATALARVRQVAPPLEGDQPLSPHIEAVAQLIRSDDWLPPVTDS